MAGESENNNSFSAANSLILGVLTTGALSTKTDVDFYKVSVTAAGTLTLTFDVPTTSSLDYFELGLFDASGTLLSLFETGQDKTYTVGVATEGTYYVGISSAYYHDSGQYSVTASHVAGSTNGFESEANDSLAAADTLTLGTAMKGQLSSNTDVDSYKLTVNQGGVLNLSFDSPTNSSYSDYFKVAVYDAQGNQLVSQESGTDLSFQTGLGAPGDYYVQVTSTDWYHDSGLYSLTATVTAGSANGFEQEPNDYYANALFSGAQIRGQVAADTDVDWYYLSTDAAGSLTVNFDAPTNSSYSDYFHVWLYDKDGNILASRSTGQDTQFTADAPAAGDYFVAITAGDYYHDTGTYGLTVTSAASTVQRESEPNDGSLQADALTLDTPIHGQLSTSADKDRFVLDLNSAGTLSVTFDGPTNSTWSNYFRINLYDATGNLLFSRDTGSDTAFDVKAPAAGKYAVEISAPGYYHDDGEYRLTVGAVLDDPVPAGAITGTTAGDRLNGTDNADLIYGLGGNDLIDGAKGSDTVVFRAWTTSLSINTIQGLTAVRGNYAAGEHAYSVSRLWNVEKLKTWDGINNLGVASATPLLGTVQNDYLPGTVGDDLIDGLGGGDFIDGGAGSDTLALFGAKDQFTVQTVVGITRIVGKEGAYEYAGFVSKTVNVETLAFNQNQTRPLETTSTNKIFGTAAANMLTGTTGDDVFDGQGGNDSIDGGTGNDTVALFGNAADFNIVFPSAIDGALKVTGKAGTAYSGQTITASNIETIAFLDRDVVVANPPKLVLSAGGTLVAEGGSGTTLNVALSVAPTTNVTVNVSGGTQLNPSVVQLTFDASNWNVPQALTVSATDDAVYEKQHTGSLTLSISTSDPLYVSVAASTVSYTISDNDAADVGSVSGTLWNDADRDGVIDAGESRLGNWRVFDDVNHNGKWDAGEASTTTDGTGAYRLEDLKPGSHTVSAQMESGWSPTYPSLSNASATVISNTAGSGEVSIEAITETVVSAETAASTYANLGTATNIAAFHADPRFADINGQGYSVVVIDSGIDLNHPYFGPDNDGNGVADRIVYDQDFYGVGDLDASDGMGHGTHVAGIIGSSNATYPGVAPKINIISLKVFSDSGQGDDGTALKKAANWVVENASKYNVVAVNLSLGFSNFDKTPVAGILSPQLQSLASNGVVVVSASGNWYADNPNTKINETGWTGVAYPSSDPYSLSVGAVWANNGTLVGLQNGTADAIAAFSQRDDTESDIFAPGIWVDSAWNDGAHKVEAGTSMASPEIAGMVALAQQLAERELGHRLTFDEIRSLLKSTGDSIVDGDNENDVVPNTGLTFKRVDMLAMAEAILAMKPPVSHSVEVSADADVSGKNFGFASTQSVQALSADDWVVGSMYGEILRGGAGNDQLSGGDGDDEIHGESGDDLLTGGSGNDVFAFAAASNGVDTITDFTVGDVIRIEGAAFTGSAVSGTGGQVARNRLEVESAGDKTILHIGTNDAQGEEVRIALQGQFAASAFVLNGTEIGVQQASNRAPAANNANASTNEDVVLSGSVSATDADGNGLTYTAVTQPGHGSLTLSANGSYTYTPAANFNGTDSFTFKANDGAADSNYATVTITVSAVNDAPVVANAIADQGATAGSAFGFTVPASAFSDIDSANLSYTATLVSGAALPAWLSFNAQTRAFSGTPTAADLGTLSVRVAASDGSLSASDTFDLTVNSLDNRITGTQANDRLQNTSGNDNIDGRTGIDTVIYSAASSNYSLQLTPSGIQLRDQLGRDGVDTLVNVELLEFTDKTVDVRTQAHGSYADVPDTLYQFFVVGFGAAAGVTYMDQMADAYRWWQPTYGNNTVKQIVEVFTTKTQFTGVYPEAMYREDHGKYYLYRHDTTQPGSPLVKSVEVSKGVFDGQMASLAQSLIDTIINESATASAKQEAVNDVRAALSLGGDWTIGKVVYTIFGNLANKPLNDVQWGGTAQQFANQVAVSKYYTEVLNQSTDDLGTLRDVMRAVTHTSDVSTDENIASLIGVALMHDGVA